MNKKDNFFLQTVDSECQDIIIDDILLSNFTVTIKREDQIHDFVSGNKYRKLKYNLAEAINKNSICLLTFGGAYSNHIAAVASAGFEMGLETIGIIRGEEIAERTAGNPTLSFAKSKGMQLHFVSREEYKKKTDLRFINFLREKFGEFYLIPEGGTNELAVRGCEEILNESDLGFDYICTPVGTGGTIAGLINASGPDQTVIGFSSLKGTFQKDTIETFTTKRNYYLTDAYCFGGYAKIDSQLIRFINEFKENSGIPLDPIYTGKMMYGVFDLLKQGYFKENSRILAVHTGGLQGIAGMNQLLEKKKLPQIDL
ncbi:MAG: 1-aminocyclopropane-1-carboxylate deaminase [Flavobacteriaceae bacterium]|jgi:1-aminocyclopropane-1-carboxylate deaminase